MFFRILVPLTVLLTAVSCSQKPAPVSNAQKPLTGSRTEDFGCCPYPVKKLPCGNPELSKTVLRAQEKQIAQDLPVFRNRLKTIRKDLALEERLQRKWLEDRKKFELIPRIFSPETGQEIERFQNHYRWLNRNGSFYALPDKISFIEPCSINHNIKALHALNQMLSRCHIQLLVMLIPDADHIARCAFLPSTSRIPDPAILQCASTMLEFGIEAVDPEDTVRNAMPFCERLFCYPDPQPEAGLWNILAELAAKRFERFGKDSFREKTASHFSARRGKTAYGDHYRWPEKVNCGEHKNGAVVESLEVFRNGVPFRPDPNSKILVIGGETIDLPGPGHTFSGLLSMRLKYPVDELVLPGAVWFQNLPSVLSRDPDRWLAGKTVCLLILSPRMFARHYLPDIESRTELYTRLSRAQRIQDFPGKKTGIDPKMPKPVPGERFFAQKTRWNREWLQLAAGQKNSSVVRIEAEQQRTAFMTLKLPENREIKPFILVLDAAGYPGQSNTMFVNGQPVPLLNSISFPEFHPAAAELPPETTEAKLEFTGARDNLILIRNIRLYQ